MLENAETFSGFAVADPAATKEFYGEKLGLKVTDMDEQNGLMQLELAGGRNVLVYAKPDHSPGNYTILNFQVDDIDEACAGDASSAWSSSATRTTSRKIGSSQRGRPSPGSRPPGTSSPFADGRR